MTRISLALLAALAAAACAPQVPDSAAGVGFGDLDDFRTRQEADLTGDPAAAMPDGPVIGDETAGDVALPPSTEADGADGTPELDNPGISDEQNFDAVAERETIESDAERIERNRAAYVVVEPTDLPTRPTSGRPNIVAYALQTNNPVGAQLYSRGPTSDARFLRACGRYASSDLAQEEFLARGGPERDRMGVDPDGDGFACFWDPTPFRAAGGG